MGTSGNETTYHCTVNLLVPKLAGMHACIIMFYFSLSSVYRSWCYDSKTRIACKSRPTQLLCSVLTLFHTTIFWTHGTCIYRCQPMRTSCCQAINALDTVGGATKHHPPRYSSQTWTQLTLFTSFDLLYNDRLYTSVWWLMELGGGLNLSALALLVCRQCSCLLVDILPHCMSMSLNLEACRNRQVL